MSQIRQVVESMARKLSEHEYFRTTPKIPVLVEDRKDIVREIENAMNMLGAFVLLNFDSSGDSDADTPGPTLGECSFNAVVSEIPSAWRQKAGPTPSATEIGEAVSRILHHYSPTDETGEPIGGGVLKFESMTQQVNESMMQQLVIFTFPIYFPQDQPSRT